MAQPKNFIYHSIFVLLFVIASLLLLSFIDPFTVGEIKIKRINILSDVEITLPPILKQTIVPKDSNQSLSHSIDTFVNFQNRIEDYSGEKKSLANLFSAIKTSRYQPVRIAFFGDSFIEGDILCANFRDTLQYLFGGRGVGFMPITSEVSRFRTTIQHEFNNWKTYSIVGEKNDQVVLGTSGFCFIPLEGNEVSYKPASKGKTFAFNHVKLFYKSHHPLEIQTAINDSLLLDHTLDGAQDLQEFTLDRDNIHSIKLQFPVVDSLSVYGTSFEEPTGVYVDNFAMRGNSGIGLYQIPADQHRQFNLYRKYSLIILQYGLNVVNENDSTGYSWYTERMTTVINRLKESFPSSSFLLLSVSDRSSNQNGEFATIPSIPIMVEAQRKIAKKTRIAFWDTYHAMGGKNSMIKFVQAKPPMAAKDYTHVNYWGGKKIASLLSKALLQEKVNYEPRK